MGKLLTDEEPFVAAAYDEIINSIGKTLDCELYETRWVVVSFTGLESGPLTYAEAANRVRFLAKLRNRSGMTIVSVEAAGRMIANRQRELPIVLTTI